MEINKLNDLYFNKIIKHIDKLSNEIKLYNQLNNTINTQSKIQQGGSNPPPIPSTNIVNTTNNIYPSYHNSRLMKMQNKIFELESTIADTVAENAQLQENINGLSDFECTVYTRHKESYKQYYTKFRDTLVKQLNRIMINIKDDLRPIIYYATNINAFKGNKIDVLLFTNDNNNNLGDVINKETLITLLTAIIENNQPLAIMDGEDVMDIPIPDIISIGIDINNPVVFEHLKNPYDTTENIITQLVNNYKDNGEITHTDFVDDISHDEYDMRQFQDTLNDINAIENESQAQALIGQNQTLNGYTIGIYGKLNNNNYCKFMLAKYNKTINTYIDNMITSINNMILLEKWIKYIQDVMHASIIS